MLYHNDKYFKYYYYIYKTNYNYIFLLNLKSFEEKK